MIKICKETKNRNKRQISVIKKKPNNYLEALVSQGSQNSRARDLAVT